MMKNAKVLELNGVHKGNYEVGTNDKTMLKDVKYESYKKQN